MNPEDTVTMELSGLDDSFMTFDKEKSSITFNKEKIDPKKSKVSYKLQIVLEDQNNAKKESTLLIDVWLEN